MFLSLWIHRPVFTLITLDTSESWNTFWFDLLSLEEAVLRDILDAFPNLTGCFSFVKTVFISLLVTIFFLLLLNTISFLTICWCQLLLIPHGWFQENLTLLLPHRLPGAWWLKAWYFMSSEQQIAGACKGGGRTFSCSVSPLPRPRNEWDSSTPAP